MQISSISKRPTKIAYLLLVGTIFAQSAFGAQTPEEASAPPALAVPASKLFNVSHPDRIPNEYIVVFKDGQDLSKDVSTSLARGLAIAPGELPTTRESVANIGLAMAKRYRSLNLTPDEQKRNWRQIEYVYNNVFRGFSISGVSSEDIIELARDPRVAYVDASLRARATGIAESVQTSGGIICLGDSPEPVNAPCAQSGGKALPCLGTGCAPWDLDRIDQMTGQDGAYHYYADGSGVTIWDVDTGMLRTHNEFGSRSGTAEIVFNCNSTSPENCTLSQITTAASTNLFDGCGHGTSVASAAAGKVSGVAKGANIFAVNITYDHQCGLATPWLIAGLDYVYGNRQPGPNIVLFPLEIDVSANDPNLPTLERAVNALINTGTTFVASAGNDGHSACLESPARMAGVITVGATTREDVIAGYSNYGTCVTLFAPGDHVTAADVAGYTLLTGSDDGDCSVTPEFLNNTVLCTFSGTSYSAPLVAGIAALYLQNNPTASPSVVKTAIIASATPGVLLDTRFNSGSPNLLASVWVPGNDNGTVKSPGGGAPPGTLNGKEKAFLVVLDFSLTN